MSFASSRLLSATTRSMQSGTVMEAGFWRSQIADSVSPETTGDSAVPPGAGGAAGGGGGGGEAGGGAGGRGARAAGRGRGRSARRLRLDGRLRRAWRLGAGGERRRRRNDDGLDAAFAPAAAGLDREPYGQRRADEQGEQGAAIERKGGHAAGGLQAGVA